MPVGLFGLQTSDQLGRGRDLGRAIASRSWTSPVGERHPDLARARERRQVRVHREGRPGVDELGARLAERQRGGEQDLAGAVGDRDAGRARPRSARRSAGAAGRASGPGSGSWPPRRAAIASAPPGAGPNGDSLEASWAIPSSAIASGALPAGAPGDVAGDRRELLGEVDGHRLLGGVRGRRAASARLAEVDVRGAVVGRARSSGRAPGSPAPSRPGTSSSRVQSSGTRSRPTARAPTAGNCGVEVVGAGEDARETKSLGLELVAAHQLAHQLLGRGEDRIGSSLRSACTAPRTAQSGAWSLARSSARILPEPPHLGGAQPARLALGQLAELAAGRSATRVSSTTSLPTASAIRRTCRLRPSRIVSSTHPRRDAAHRAPARSARRRARRPSRSRPSSASRRRPAQPRPVGARDPVARVGEPVGELAVVGEQDQPGRVGVEAADRVEAALGVDQLDHRPAAARLARGRDDPGRLVERSRPRAARARPGARRPPPRSRLVDVARRVA